MAMTVRYFATAAAGTGDGTSHANRAILYTGGAWSTVLTGFDFSTNGMEARIEAGTYTIADELNVTDITTDPSAGFPLIFHGADSSGNLLTPPDPDWVSNQAAWSTSGLPLFQSTANISMINLAQTLFFCRLIYFQATSGRNGAILSAGQYDWCTIQNDTSNATAGGSNGPSLSNCVISMTGSIYSYCVQSSTAWLRNCLVKGVAGSSGNRYGISNTGNASSHDIRDCTVVGVGGVGIIGTGATASHRFSVTNSTIVGCGSDGILLPSTAAQTDTHSIIGCQITGNGGWGINGNTNAHAAMMNNRFRDNTSGSVTGFTNAMEYGSYTTDSDDATEYVNSGSADYRIVNTAATWGGGYGVADGPPASGGGLLTHPGMSGGMRA